MFMRVLGRSKKAAGVSACRDSAACPDIVETETGDFVAIGKDVTELAAKLPHGAGCGPTERMVLIPRHILVAAKADIPNEV
jgi:hypothetical protein